MGLREGMSVSLPSGAQFNVDPRALNPDTINQLRQMGLDPDTYANSSVTENISSQPEVVSPIEMQVQQELTNRRVGSPSFLGADIGEFVGQQREPELSEQDAELSVLRQNKQEADSNFAINLNVKQQRRKDLQELNQLRAEQGLPPKEMPENLKYTSQELEVLGPMSQPDPDVSQVVPQPNLGFQQQQEPNLLYDGLNMAQTGVQQQMFANTAAADIVSRRSLDSAKAFEETFKNNQEFLTNFQAQNEKNRQLFEKRIEQANQKIKELNEKKVDPNRFYKRAGTGGTILAAISTALGAFGSGQTGSPNFAMQIIQNAIDRDLQAQRDELETKRSAVSGELNLLGQMRQIFNDDFTAELATRNAMLQGAKLQLDSVSQRAESDLAKTNAMALNGALLERQGQLQAEISLKAQKASGVKSVPDSVATRLSQINAGLAGVEALKLQAKDLGLLSPITQLIPGTAAKKYDNNKNIFAETFGAATRGSTESRDQSIKRARNILGDSSDAAFGTLEDKLDAAQRELQRQKDAILSTFEQQGVDVSNFKGRTPSEFIENR